ncbi:MAG: hypothetical protein RR424_03895 [Oscillospiraceae bacterium]
MDLDLWIVGKAVINVQQVQFACGKDYYCYFKSIEIAHTNKRTHGLV